MSSRPPWTDPHLSTQARSPPLAHRAYTPWPPYPEDVPKNIKGDGVSPLLASLQGSLTPLGGAIWVWNKTTHPPHPVQGPVCPLSGTDCSEPRWSPCAQARLKAMGSQGAEPDLPKAREPAHSLAPQPPWTRQAGAHSIRSSGLIRSRALPAGVPAPLEGSPTRAGAQSPEAGGSLPVDRRGSLCV